VLSRRQFLTGAALAAATTVINITGDVEKVPEYTFNDDFDGSAGSAPDPTKWMYELGGGGHAINDLQTYTNSRANSYIDGNSNLVIAATNTGGSYQSAQLRTQGLFSQLGGHFEARIQLNVQLGLWPAFWLMGEDLGTVNWPLCGEIDILENFGYTNNVASTVHVPVAQSGQSLQQVCTVANDGAWHVWRMDVEQEGITFFRDGYEYGHVPASFCPPADWVFGPGEPNNGGMFFLLNIAVGGNMAQSPPPASTNFPATMLVDYVRAWA